VKYRPEIDGLRAIAVLTVMLYHAGFSFMSGGYLGVDIFFVISGFLITSIIRREVLNNNFSITRFYERRIRRILPALYIVMAASLSASWFIQTPQQLIAQFESILSILLYVSNFYFLSQNDYFASDAALSPLIHTWSLAVEEQFYVIFPVFLILIMKQKRVDIRLILAAACTISLGTTFFVDKYDPNANFFFTTSRVWELGIGCLLACMPAPQKDTPNLTNIITVISLCIIAASVVLFTNDMYHPSPLTLIPVLATAALIRYTKKGCILYSALANKYVVQIGLYSYSAYLWHQPLFALYRTKYYEHIDPINFLPLIILTFALAHFTWKYAEMPLRSKTLVRYRHLLIVLGLLTALFASISIIGIKNDGFRERFKKYGSIQIFEQQTNPKPFMTECVQHYNGTDIKQILSACSLGIKKTEDFTFIIWGDSHAGALSYGLDKHATRHKISGLQLSSNGCPVSPVLTRGDQPKMRANCHKDAQRALNIIKDIKPRNLLVQTRWALHFESTRHDNLLGGKEHGHPISIKKVNDNYNLSDIDLFEYYVDYFIQLAAEMETQNTRLILISSTPEAGWNVPEKMLRSINNNSHFDTSIARSTFDTRNYKATALFEILSKVPNITIINPSDVFCDGNVCRQSENAIPYYMDDDHLSKFGSTKLAQYIFEQLGLE
jgi:peptidoglycan/LPS O-acetylase OafA/YrhL